MNENLLIDLLNKFIANPDHVAHNLNLAIYYDTIGQTASAVSYYLRTAERTDQDIIKYQCVLRSGICFSKQGCRNFTVKGLYQHGLTIMPNRPEGYFLLSRFYEREENYHDAYLISSIGEKIADREPQENLILDVEYPGFYGVLFEKAVSSWWVGLCNESRDLLENLLANYQLDEIHLNAVKENISKLGDSGRDLHRVYLPKRLKEFDWGFIEKVEWIKSLIEKEVFIDDVYQKQFKVQEGDVVVDFGASVGPFTHLIKENNPSKVYCLEPHPETFEKLVENVSDENVVCINKAVAASDRVITECSYFNETMLYTNKDIRQEISTISFKDFIEENNIEKIDFLKTDCEGGEYDIFNRENIGWIMKNVHRISGEWHLNTPEQKEKFKEFREIYLSQFPKYSIQSIDYVDMKWALWEDWFVDKYSQLNIYIDNIYFNNEKVEEKKPLTLKQPKEKWKNSIAPTMEFTTSIPENGCVVDCVFCPQRTLQKVYTGERTMSLDNFKIAVDKLPQEVRVTFAGFTEPWLNKYCTDMVLYAHEKGHPVSVFTTGIGMSIDDIERIKHIPFAGNPNGGFVLHLPDQERKAKHPITKRYVEVIEHFGKIYPQIHNFTTMAMGTVHERVNHVFRDAPVYGMWSRAGNLLGESIMKPELLNRKDEYRSIYHGEKEMTCGCLEKMYHNVMLPNGDVSLCCMDYGLEHILGNLYEQSYEDVIPDNFQCFNLCRFCENATKPPEVV